MTDLIGLLAAIGMLALVIFGVVHLNKSREAAQERVCAPRGLQVVTGVEWHGKYSTTYYACRDPNTGQVYTLENR